VTVYGCPELLLDITMVMPRLGVGIDEGATATEPSTMTVLGGGGAG
jgi:hypothetical protein